MWLLAFKAMLSDRGKVLTALAGVAFSVALINLQAGLLVGLLRKSCLLVDFGQADIWVGHRHMSNVDMGTFIPERWLERLRSLDGVERAEPYVVMFGQISMPDGRFENVVIVGCEPASLLGNAWALADGDPRAVRDPDGVLVDRCDLDRLGQPRIGECREINGRRARVVGLTQGIVGFTTNPYVFTTLERARRHYTVGVPPDGCSYYLVKARPGADLDLLCARIRERVPELDVYERDRFARSCMAYWLTRTGIGISFGLAAALGLLVGLAVVAQTLCATVNERLREFATLKAMGASDAVTARFLVAQAVGSAGLGSAAGLAGSWILAQLLHAPRAPVLLSPQVALGSVGLILVVCLLAVRLPYARIRRLDPAHVLRGQ